MEKGDEVRFEHIRPFGPSVLKAKIPERIVSKLNDYMDSIVADQEKSKNLNYGSKLAGDVTQEFKLEKDLATKIGWIDFLGFCTSKWIEMELKKKIKKFGVLESWVVRQFQNEYNPVHWHNGHISGAGFLKLPKSFGDYVQNEEKKEKLKVGGNLNLIHGQRSFLSSPIFSIKPQVGDFYFFPSYLMHTVYPFKGTSEERRSISFNAIIDPEIATIEE